MRIGRKKRLGLLFGAALYPRMLDIGEVPGLEVPARPEALTRLVRSIVHFDIYIYPRSPAFGRPAQLIGWLTTRSCQYFEDMAFDEPHKHAVALVAHCAPLGYLPVGLDRYVDEERPWPSWDELASLDEALLVLELELAATVRTGRG